MEDPRTLDIADGVVLRRAISGVLAVLLGVYGVLLLTHGEELWALDTYGPALSIPGKSLTWGVIAVLSSILIVVGSATRHERVVGAGSSLAALWLTFFSMMFGVAAVRDENLVAAPGVLVYGCMAALAIARTGISVGGRR